MPVEQDFPAPLVIAPEPPTTHTHTHTHTHTFIFLHGRGSKADILANELVPALKQAFPTAKLVFPRARKQRATVYKKSITRQWFDDWHLSPDLQATDVVHARYDEGLQTSGLGETVAYLHALVREEARLVGGGAQNVVLGGFSQGAAACLVAALLWDGEERLGVVVALSGWLPYVSQMTELLASGGGDCDEQDIASIEAALDCFDPFERSVPASGEGDASSDGVQAAREWLRDEVDMQPDGHLHPPHGKIGDGGTAVLFCHGLDDRQVEPDRSQDAVEFFGRLRLRLGLGSLRRKCYDDTGHEVSGEMVDEVVAFLQFATS
ncbi:unnamed protein product [Discula destructiva]